MQENRAFDHYYGMHQGVRGFNDRTAVQLPSGLPAFYQPVNQNNLSEYMLPFHVDSMTTSATCMDAPTMDYPHDIGIINHGRFDSWNTARAPGMGMSYWNRSDLPYYYKLYESFCAGDQYFQSTYTMTNPNRLHLFSGSNGLSVGKPAVLDNHEPVPGWTWETMAETLENAGVTWKTYQEADNFDGALLPKRAQGRGALAPLRASCATAAAHPLFFLPHRQRERVVRLFPKGQAGLCAV